MVWGVVGRPQLLPVWTTLLGSLSVLTTWQLASPEWVSDTARRSQLVTHCHSVISSWFLHGRRLCRGVMPGEKCHWGILEAARHGWGHSHRLHQLYPVWPTPPPAVSCHLLSAPHFPSAAAALTLLPPCFVSAAPWAWAAPARDKRLIGLLPQIFSQMIHNQSPPCCPVQM